MSPSSTGSITAEHGLIERARARDETAFARLVDPYRRELHAHCYRMLGSVHDAEDALQEALLRAWRGLAKFKERSSLRSWLYTILGVEDGFAAPDATYERRESVELAFIAALQHLPATQRAVLIQREVLGFSAKEVAASLDTTVASVNSALQRARAAVEERVPERSQQATLRALGEDSVREIVDRYVDAWERCDIDAFAAMLAEDATFTMPPLASWYDGREAIIGWATRWPLSGAWRWRAIRARANGQPALGFYAYDRESDSHRPFALNVLSLRGERVSGVSAFIARSAAPREREVFERYPDEPLDAGKVDDVFGRFGLPVEFD